MPSQNTSRMFEPAIEIHSTAAFACLLNISSEWHLPLHRTRRTSAAASQLLLPQLLLTWCQVSVLQSRSLGRTQRVPLVLSESALLRLFPPNFSIQ